MVMEGLTRPQHKRPIWDFTSLLSTDIANLELKARTAQ